MRIRVCIPFYAEYEATKSGIAELEACAEHEFVVEERRGTYIGKTRNHLVNEGRSSEKWQSPLEGFDAFLTIDSDISFTLADVLKLISHDKDIVCAPYLVHNSADTYECGFFNETAGSIKLRANTTWNGLRFIEWAGSGFMLIKRHVFNEMEYPWYRHAMVRDGELQEESGEDIGFCMGAHIAGYKIYCDFDIAITHHNQTFNWRNKMEKVDPKKRIKEYYQSSLKLRGMAEKEEAKLIAAAEIMGWGPEETNEILGAQVIAPMKKPEPVGEAVGGAEAPTPREVEAGAEEDSTAG